MGMGVDGDMRVASECRGFNDVVMTGKDNGVCGVGSLVP
jgi:hypothetical protein